jgi:DNA-binding transcriptional MerR regulator
MMESQINNQIHIPNKRYFTIGEVSKICKIKTHVLRYWEQEFKELEPIKRKGNRRYYQQKDLILVLEIRNLLHNEGFTIEGAKTKINNSEKNITNTNNNQTLNQIKQDLENLLSILKR